MNIPGFKQWFNSLQTRSALGIIILAGVLIEATSAVQYWYASKRLQEEVQQRAESELRIKNLEIQKVMIAVETAINNSAASVEELLSQPDSLYKIARRIVEKNNHIVGVGMLFKANYYPQKGRWYEPYVVQRNDGKIEQAQIGGPDHDYLNANWFKAAIAAERGYWSEPYYDEAGAMMMLSTYSTPIRNSQGETVGLLVADVPLDWLSEVINAQHIYSSSYDVLISRTGQIMVCPVESLVMQNCIEVAKTKFKDTTISNVNSQMMAMKSGKATVTDDQGEKKYIFYAPVGGDAGWSMAVVCSESEIYHGLRQLRLHLLVLMFIGLALLTYILIRTIQGFKRLQEVYAEKERIGCELHIASTIQMGMLPKTCPSTPERDDIDVFGQLTPAKEVGGDLYDYYIRDEKLFFCIGDVSGKGIPASLVMAVTRSLFRTISTHEALPDRIVTAINESMSETIESNMFVTLFVGVLDLPTGHLCYCNAGHNAPLLINENAEFLPVDNNIPIGIMADWKYSNQESQIGLDTTIFLYTDGLTEAERTDHTQFGIERVCEVIKNSDKHQSSKALVNHMSDAVNQFVGEADQSDDMTLLGVKYIKQHQATLFSESITLPNNVQEVPKLNEFVDKACEAVKLDMSTTMKLNLAIEEAVVNVMNYAYPAGTEGTVKIEAVANDVRLKFVITDKGTAFDPTAKKEVDTTLSAEERSIGGLGIHLVRQIMDSINYERVNGMNVLTLRKKL